MRFRVGIKSNRRQAYYFLYCHICKDDAKSNLHDNLSLFQQRHDHMRRLFGNQFRRACTLEKGENILWKTPVFPGFEKGSPLAGSPAQGFMRVDTSTELLQLAAFSIEKLRTPGRKKKRTDTERLWFLSRSEGWNSWGYGFPCMNLFGKQQSHHSCFSLRTCP